MSSTLNDTELKDLAGLVIAKIASVALADADFFENIRNEFKMDEADMAKLRGHIDAFVYQDANGQKQTNGFDRLLADIVALPDFDLPKMVSKELARPDFGNAELIGLREAINEVLMPGGENLNVQLVVLNIYDEPESDEISSTKLVAVALAPGNGGQSDIYKLADKAAKLAIPDFESNSNIEFSPENPLLLLDGSTAQKVQELFAGADGVEIEDCIEFISEKRCSYQSDSQWVVDSDLHDEREAKVLLLESIAEKHFDIYKKSPNKEIYTSFQAIVDGETDLHRIHRDMHQEIDIAVQGRLDESLSNINSMSAMSA